jgi:biotin carboxyl carrier protein
MQIEIPSVERQSQVELLEKKGSQYSISVDGKRYDLDIVMVENGAYSILHEGRSFNIETIQNDTNQKKYTVNTIFTSYDIELVDAATKYMRSRQGDDAAAAGNNIVVPMPGKIVSVLVKPGQKVAQGETLVIVSAMKMESEYKAHKESVIDKVLVKEGDTVDGGQIMVTLS